MLPSTPVNICILLHVYAIKLTHSIRDMYVHCCTCSWPYMIYKWLVTSKLSKTIWNLVLTFKSQSFENCLKFF